MQVTTGEHLRPGVRPVALLTNAAVSEKGRQNWKCEYWATYSRHNGTGWSRGWLRVHDPGCRNLGVTMTKSLDPSTRRLSSAQERGVDLTVDLPLTDGVIPDHGDTTSSGGHGNDLVPGRHFVCPGTFEDGSQTCRRDFATKRGLSQHMKSAHPGLYTLKVG